MVYNTADIVKRARQLADLENSDFIGYNENVQLLNETYNQLYQKLINRADKSYLKKLENPVKDKFNKLPDNAIAYILPRDFYQLNSVTYGVAEFPILRKAKTESPLTSPRYDIVNDEIVIYGGANLQDIRITYYPVPCTLYLSAPTKEIDLVLPSSGRIILDVNFNRALVKNTTATKVFIVDLETNEQIEVDILTAISNNGIQYGFLESPDSFTLIDKNSKGYFYNINTDSFTNIGSKPVLRCSTSNGSIYYEAGYAQGDIYKDCTVWEYNLGDSPAPICKTDLPNYLFDNVLFPVAAKYYNKIYLYTRNISVPGSSYTEWLSVYDLATNTQTPLWPISRTSSFIPLVRVDGNGNVYFRDSVGLKRNGEVLSYEGKYVVGITSIDFDTGYGVLLKSKDKWFIDSIFPNTTLYFPQNFYYSAIAYSLAVAYGAKQGKDISALSAQLNNSIETFYDTVERDDNAPTRIANFYR